MELLEYLCIIKKRIWLILGIVTLSMLTSAVISKYVIVPVYEAKSTLIIGRTQNSPNDKVGYDDILMYEKLVKTYSELAQSRLVIEEAISTLQYDTTYDRLIKDFSITPKPDTQILEITFQDNNADMAARVTNTLGEVFINKVGIMMNTNDVKIMDKARVPKEPIKPKLFLNIFIAGLCSLMISLGLVFLMEYLDNTIRTENDIKTHLGYCVIACIPYIKK